MRRLVPGMGTTSPPRARATWPGFTAELVSQLLHPVDEFECGHLISVEAEHRRGVRTKHGGALAWR